VTAGLNRLEQQLLDDPKPSRSRTCPLMSSIEFALVRVRGDHRGRIMTPSGAEEPPCGVDPCGERIRHRTRPATTSWASCPRETKRVSTRAWLRTCSSPNSPILCLQLSGKHSSPRHKRHAVSAGRERRFASSRLRPNPLAPIRVAGSWTVAGGRRALAAAFNPTGPTGALVQTRDLGGAGRTGRTLGIVANHRWAQARRSAWKEASVERGRKE
jgi:hypothetical protein